MSRKIYCACGLPLHYSDYSKRLFVERQIVELGADVPVRMGTRTWIVPRHYIALHGVKASELPRLRFPEVLNKAIIIPYLHSNGGMRINTDQPPNYREQFFSHIDPDDDRIRHFDVLKLSEMIKQSPAAYEIAEFALEPQQVEFIMKNRGFDEAHVTNRMADDAYLAEPGIICLFEDTTQLIVDGTHRFVARARRQMETMKFWLVPEDTWRKVLLRLPNQFDLEV